MKSILFAATFSVLAASALLGSSSPAEAANCGALNQKPCTVFQRIPSCDAGLVEIPFTRCVRPKRNAVRPGIDCGRANQRACKFFERIPSCNRGLVEVLGKGICADPRRAGIDCGNQNQRPCTLTERVPSCNDGLVEDLLKGQCRPGPHWREYQLAYAKLAEISGVIAASLGPAIAIERTGSLLSAVARGDTAAAEREMRRYLDSRLTLPDGTRLRTATVGVGGGAKVIIGGSGGVGVAIDATLTSPPTTYSSSSWSISLGAGVGADAELGMWVCDIRAISGNVWGIEMGVSDILKFGKVVKGVTKFSEAVKPGFGVGIGLWFDYNNRFQGFTISPGIGAGIDFGGYVRGQTTSAGHDSRVNCNGTRSGGGSIAPPVSTACGAKGMRPCRISERIPSCNRGLVEDFARNLCVAPNSGQTRAPGPITRIQQIALNSPYGKGVAVHSKQNNAARNARTTRICLINSTDHPKSIQHNRAGINTLSAPPGGGRSCANFPSNMRLEFFFVDRNVRVKRSAMNLQAYAGDIVYFDWRKQ